MTSKYGFYLIDVDEFYDWMKKQNITRTINKIQLHHTYSPSYSGFNGSNHFERQQSMKEFHVNDRGFADIAQHFTIFPDGKIMSGRNLNSSPAGIVGANTGAICIENFGNFDKNGDKMTKEQHDSIIKVCAVLCEVLKLNPSTAIIYHAWYSASGSNLGDYIPSKSAKTCPGTNFFGGNTKKAFTNNLLPLIQKEMDGEEDMKIYKHTTEMPDWARDTFVRLIKAGVVKVDKNGEIAVQESALQPMVYLDRLFNNQIEKILVYAPEIVKIVNEAQPNEKEE